MDPYQFVGGVAGPRPDLPGSGGQLGAAGGAVVVVRVVHLAPEPEWLAVDDGAGVNFYVNQFRLFKIYGQNRNAKIAINCNSAIAYM
jgi:hypothetical protein